MGIITTPFGQMQVISQKDNRAVLKYLNRKKYLVVGGVKTDGQSMTFKRQVIAKDLHRAARLLLEV